MGAHGVLGFATAWLLDRAPRALGEVTAPEEELQGAGVSGDSGRVTAREGQSSALRNCEAGKPPEPGGSLKQKPAAA